MPTHISDHNVPHNAPEAAAAEAAAGTSTAPAPHNLSAHAAEQHAVSVCDGIRRTTNAAEDRPMSQMMSDETTSRCKM